MNCDDFNDWLHSQLDSRTELSISYDAKTHLKQCDLCRGQLDAWQQISSILPTDYCAKAIELAPTHEGSRRRNSSRTTTWALVSAAVLIGCILSIGQSIRNANTVALADASGTQDTNSSAIQSETILEATSVTRDNVAVIHSVEQTTQKIDPSSWWQEVQGTDWIGNTMPTVQSMRDGVAPLGRSFVQAVTLLTRIGGDQTS